MKLTLNIFEKRQEDEEKRWPKYVFRGRLRTSTLALLVAFIALLWIQAHEQTGTSSSKTTTVAPPPPPGYTFDNRSGGNRGYVPDPKSDYTLVPRTQLQPPSTTAPPPPTTTTTSPPFVLPTLPCIAPFCTPSPSPGAPTPGPSQQPPLELGPSPTPSPPAR
jgi:hypothetical protein